MSAFKDGSARARRHFELIGQAKAESHQLSAEEASRMDPFERAVIGLAMHRAWVKIIGREPSRDEPEFSLKRIYDAAQRDKPLPSDRS